MLLQDNEEVCKYGIKDGSMIILCMSLKSWNFLDKNNKGGSQNIVSAQDNDIE